MQLHRNLVGLAVLSVGVSESAWALDGVSVTTHFEGANGYEWTTGGYGPIWRHDLIDNEVVARRKLHDGPGRMAVLSHDGTRVAFVRRYTGVITVMTIGGESAREVVTAHETGTLDWPDDDTVYYNFGNWYSPSGSRNLRRVNVDTGVDELVVQWDSGIWRFGIANDEVRMVARPTGGPADGRIAAYELPGDGSFDPTRATEDWQLSCSTAMDPLGEYFVDGMPHHDGFDIRDWETMEIVRTFYHAEVTTLWGPDHTDSGAYHIRNGWSANSQDWICAHISWGDDVPYAVTPRGANQVLYSWKQGSEGRIVVTPNQDNSYAYDSAGDFWVGPPPVPAAVGLRAHWLFDAGGLVFDAVGPHTLVNDGVTSGAGMEQEAAELVAAEGDRLRIADASLSSGTPWKLADGRPEMTVAGWFKKNRTGEREYLLQKGLYSFGLLIAPGTADEDDFCVELARYPHNVNAATEQVRQRCWHDVVPADTWMFFAVTLNAARELRVRLWDQTVGAWLGPDLAEAITEPPIFTGADLVIGCGEWDGSEYCFDGSIDGLRLYDHGMTASQIAALLNPPDCAGDGGACCPAADICGAVRPGSGCPSGAICCDSGACAPPACGDGLCSAEETCDLDSCCAGQRFDGVTSVCCFGVFTPGECCNNADCTEPASCTEHACVTPTFPPLAHWAMSADALTADSVGGNTLVSDGAIPGAGKRGGGAAFAGDEALTIADGDLDAGMPLASTGGGTTLTITGWLHRSRDGVFEYVLQKGGQTEGKLSLGVYLGGDNHNDLCVEAGEPGGGGTQDFCLSYRIRTNRWYFFGVSLGGAGELRIHLWDDDAAAWQSPSGGGLASPINIADGALHIGNGEWGGNNQGFAGILDEVRIYDYPMSAEQLEDLRNRDASGPNVPPIVDAGADQTDVNDSTVLGIDATVSDGNGDPLALLWTLVSGPGAVTLATPDELVTLVTFTAAGDHIFRLSADDGAVQISDEVAVNVSSLPSIELTSPVGGEIWRVGEVNTITWTADRVNDVAIRYTTDGVSWELIEQSVDDESASWGAYPWIIPDQPSTDCQVRLEGYFDASNAVVSGVFEIRKAGDDSRDPDDGCDCSGSGAPSVLLLALFVFVRRRR